MKLLFTILALSCGLTAMSRGDYMIPDMQTGLSGITDILDVRVTAMDKEGKATIEILKAYKQSKAPAKKIIGTSLSCTGGPPGVFGLKSGQRYIVLLVKNHLYEEQSFFAVKEEAGVSRVNLGWYGKNWFGSKTEWVSLADFEAKLKAALAAQENPKN